MTGYGPVDGQTGIIHYDQTKCFVELFLKDLKVSGQSKFWLETCNIHAVASAIDAVGGVWREEIPVGPDGKPVYTRAGYLFLLLYSQYGQLHAPYVKEGQNENEFKQNLAWAAETAAGVKAVVVNAKDGADLVAKMDASLKAGKSIAISYLTDYKTGHFISVVWRNGVPGTFEAMDSWPANMHCKRGGDHEIYTDEFFKTRCSPDRLAYIEISKLEA